jgi:hypothetical protein
MAVIGPTTGPVRSASSYRWGWVVGRHPGAACNPGAQVIVRAGEVLMNPDTVQGEGRLHAQKKPGSAWLLDAYAHLIEVKNGNETSR